MSLYNKWLITEHVNKLTKLYLIIYKNRVYLNYSDNYVK